MSQSKARYHNYRKEVINMEKDYILNNHLRGREVYIKFGKEHGRKGRIERGTFHKGEPAFIVRLNGGGDIIKRQKNCILIGGSFDV